MVYKGKNFSNAFSSVTNNRREEDKKKVSELELKNKELIDVLNMEKNNITEINLSEIIFKDNIRTSNYDTKDLEQNLLLTGQLVPVILTSDFYLIDGYRRYLSLKNIGEIKIKVSFIKESFFEIENNFKELQYFTNEERKNLDNFDLSDFYNSYTNLSNVELANKFNKSQGFISEIKTLKNISESLKILLRQFQVYSYSKEKFVTTKDIESDNFYQKNKGVFIGLRSLYKIAISKNQNKTFFLLFKNRLSEKEQQTFLTLFDILETKEEEKTDIISAKKSINSFFKDIKNQVKVLFTEEKQKIINEKIKELEQLMK